VVVVTGAGWITPIGSVVVSMSGPLAAFADTSIRHVPQFNAKSRQSPWIV
jgi:hypothetical protein